MKQLNWYQIFGNTHIIPDGKTVTPTDDIQTLLHCANIWDKSYTTLAEVLADDDTLFLICISNNAIDYMVRSTTWAVKNPLVPTMTSDNTPSGVCSASGVINTGYEAYRAFDGNSTNTWISPDGTSNQYVTYYFGETKTLKMATFFAKARIGGADTSSTNLTIKTSMDGVTYTDVSTTTSTSALPADTNNEIIFTDYVEARYIRFLINGYNQSVNGGRCIATEIQVFDDCIGIATNESAMQYIGASDYASETLLSDSTWLTAIDGSAYKDYVLNAKVPTMTSDTTPSGECFGSSYYNDSRYRYYRSFDGTISSSEGWNSSENAQTEYIGYDFSRDVVVAKVELAIRNSSYPQRNVTLRGSHDKVTWDDISVLSSNITDTSLHDYSVGNKNSYQYYSIQSTAGNGNVVTFAAIQFYGRQPAGVQSWLKAGGIEGKKYTTVSEVLSDLTTLATLMSSTDAIDYLVTAKGWATEICSDSNAMADIGMNNYAANTLLADETWLKAIANSAYIESVMNVKAPTMTSNTTPYGVVSASGTNTNAWRAMDGSFDTTWTHSDGVSTSGYLQYHFSSPKRINRVPISPYVSSRGLSIKQFSITASNDNFSTSDTLYTSEVFSNTTTIPSTYTMFATFLNSTEYSDYRLNILSTYDTSKYIGVKECQFYGRKDI